MGEGKKGWKGRQREGRGGGKGKRDVQKMEMMLEAHAGGKKKKRND